MSLVHNPHIKKALKDRWKELGLNKISAISNDASERNPEMKITVDRLSRYLSGKPGGITETPLLWLCVRYGVDVSINIGRPLLEEGKLKFVVAKYDELECLKKLNLMFPKVTTQKETKPLKTKKNGKK